METRTEMNKSPKPVSLRKLLFSFASFRDKCLITIGLICSSLYAIRFILINVFISNLYFKFSLFDLKTPLDKIENLHNDTDTWSLNIKNMFGTTSVPVIISANLDQFCVLTGGTTVFLCFCYYGMLATLESSARHQALRAMDMYLKSIMRQDMSWFDENQTGKLISQTADDFQKFEDAIGFKFGHLTYCVLGYIIPFVYCMYLEWKLTLVAACFTPLYMLSFKILATSRRVYSKRESNDYAKAGSIAEEVLGSIRTVAAFGGEEIEIQRYASHLKNDTTATCWKGIFASIAMSIFHITLCAGFGVSAYYGYYLYTSDDNLGPHSTRIFDIMTVILAINTCGFRLSEAFGHVDALSQATASAGRIFQLIEKVPSINHSEDEGIILNKPIQNISFKNISFNYPTRQDLKILDDFNLDVTYGETIAIVGESGSGKSTLISLLQRFYDVKEGSVLLNDTDIKQLSPLWVRNQIGLVGQEPVLFPTTIAENISYGKIEATQEEIESAAKLANAHSFIEELPMKYQTLVGDRGAQLSGGQKQRIAIARALIRNPQILLLDEATSALDSQSEAVVQAALEKASEGRTTIIIAHRLSTIRNANRIAVVSLGKVIEIGTHEQLMKLEGLYHTYATKQLVDVEPTKMITKVKAKHEIISDDRYIVENSENDKSSDKFASDSAKPRTRTFLRLFRVGYLESFLLVMGIIGSILYGMAFVILGVQLLPQLAMIFSYNDNGDSSTKKALKEYLFSMIIFGFMFLIAVVLQMGILAIAGALLARKLRQSVFSSMIRQRISFFDNSKNSVGSLCLLLSVDIGNIKNTVSVHMGIVLTVATQMVLAVAITFLISWRFGLIQFSLFAICVSASVALHVLLQKKHADKVVDLRISNELLRQTITNMRTVVSLGLESRFRQKLMDTHAKKTFPKWKENLLSILNAIVENSSQVGIVLIGVVAIPMLIGGDVVLMQVFRCMGVVFLTNTVARSVAVIPNFVAAINSVISVFDIIDKRPKISTAVDIMKDTPIPLTGEEELIEFKNVSFSYPTRRNAVALNGFNLNVGIGQMVALVGSSGCGKSTCMQLLERFYEPDDGSIILAGKNIADLEVQRLRRTLAIVQQEPMLFDRSIADNIAYGDNTRVVTMEEIVEAATIANAHEFITELPQGYHTKVGERGTQISGGQKQRIAIARALVRRSKIILMDEATSALDTETEKNVQRSLQENKRGTTFIIVAHRLSTIIDADLIVVVNKGKVVEMGTHTELMAKEAHYYKLHQSHV